MRFLPLIILLSLILSPPSAQAQEFAQEGAGLLVSDLNGALPKALWRDQPRSEITYMINNLPADSSLRSIQVIKRSMLLSTYDTSLIKNDMAIKYGSDLLTLRLRKLMELGLWEDAFQLYTKTTTDPGQNDELAQIGVLLILVQKGLSTACLEGKVVSTKFASTLFWQQLDKVCRVELGMGKAPPEFDNSAILQSIFFNKSFKISANDVDVLAKLTPLELGILALKERIDYSNLTLTEATPPHIVKTYLEDPKFPSAHKSKLERIARQKALLPPADLPAGLEAYEDDVKQLSQSALKQLVSAKLIAEEPISAKEIESLLALAEANPENYVYVQLINVINATDTDTRVSEEKLQSGLENFSPEKRKKVNFLKSLLDKSSEFSNNPVSVYEKQISLTPDGHYVMPTGNLANWLIRTKQHRFAGLSLLIILSNVENNASAASTEDTPDTGMIDVLESLSTVGLIDQAHQVAQEKLAALMVDN